MSAGEDTAISWTSPPTFVTGQIVGAADLNTYLRDNLNWLLNGRCRLYTRTAGSYTTTSASVVDADATNLAFTLNNAGTRVLVTFCGQASQATGTNAISAYINLDGVDGPAYPIWSISLPGGGTYLFCYTLAFTVSVGSHTWKLRWSTAGGTTATLFGTSSQPFNMVVAELG